MSGQGPPRETDEGSDRIGRLTNQALWKEDPRRAGRVWVLTAGVWMGTAVAVVAGVIRTDPSGPQFLEGAIWLALLVLMNQLPPLTSRTGKEFDIRFPFLLAAAFLYGPLIGAGLAGLADMKWCRDGRQVRHMLVNSWVAAWSVAAAGVTFEVVGGEIGRAPIVLLGAAMAVAVDMLVNYLLVAWVDLVWYRIPIRDGFDHMRFGSLAETFASHFTIGMTSLPICALQLVIGPWSLAVGLALLAGSRLALSRSRDLQEAKEQLSERDEVIRGINSLVAKERTDERRLIAASMHDDVIQSLHYLTLHAQVIREDLRHGKLLQLEEDIPLLLEISRRTADQARSLVGDLRSSPLGRAGLTESLSKVVDELSGRRDVRFHIDIEDVAGDAQQETLMYHVAKEALANAAAHAGATTIRVRLAEVSGQVLLVVEDDGRGFPPGADAKEGHFGVSLMRERVAAAGGTIQIASEIGVGTRVVATFPMAAKSSTPGGTPPGPSY